MPPHPPLPLDRNLKRTQRASTHAFYNLINVTFLIYNPVVSDAYFESQSRIRFSVITDILTCCVCLVGNELEGG